MKSRLAVSILFILIAATLASHTATFRKVLSRAGERCDRQKEQISNHAPSPSPVMERTEAGDGETEPIVQLGPDRMLFSPNCAGASEPCVVGTISRDGTTITLSSLVRADARISSTDRVPNLVFRLVRSDSGNGSFGGLAAVVHQIREVIGLVRMK